MALTPARGSPAGRPAAGDPGTGEIARFWAAHPVGADFVRAGELREFLERYDRRRDATEPHIRGELEGLDLRGRRVLEIGTGQGTESQRLMEAGARYVGLDFSPVAIRTLRAREQLFGVSAEGAVVAAAEAIPFPDESFDLVFSHGVIHHSPRIAGIVAEIHRVLAPGGRAIVMLYHRHSANYHISIRVLRRLGAALLLVPGGVRAVAALMGEPPARLAAHADALRAEGLAYLRMDRFIHRATDGPHNVYSSVWSRADARRLFAAFPDIETRVHHLNERHFPGLARLLPASVRDRLARRFGWHLWVAATRAGPSRPPHRPPVAPPRTQD
jgi:SAM-dependent methyltransferase